MNRKELLALKAKLQQDIAAIDRVLSIITPPPAHEKGLKSKPENGIIVAQPHLNGFKSDSDFVTNKSIRDAIMEQRSAFSTSNITDIIKKRFPGKPIRTAAVPSVVFRLKKTNLITELPEKDGKKQYEVVYK